MKAGLYLQLDERWGSGQGQSGFSAAPLIAAHSFSQQRIALSRFALKIVGMTVGLNAGPFKIYMSRTGV
jgi:hypothetical protein